MCPEASTNPCLAMIEMTCFTSGQQLAVARHGDKRPVRILRLAHLLLPIAGRHPDDASRLSLDLRRHELDAGRIDPAVRQVHDKTAVQLEARHLWAKMVGERRRRLVVVFNHEAAHAARARHPHVGDPGLSIERTWRPRIHVKMQIEGSLEQASTVGFPT
jgi:hypothetical protein